MHSSTHSSSIVSLAVCVLTAASCGSSDAETLETEPVVEEVEPAPATAPAPAPGPPVTDYRVLDARGDEHLKAGRFAEAVADFDAAIELEPRLEPYHWRRGIAQYYAGLFEEGAQQFEVHRTVNGNDVENTAWHFLCVARLRGVDAAREAMLPVQPDSRVPMMVVVEMFAGRKTPDDVLAAAGESRGAQSESALFYGHLYVGLYHEALGDAERARHHIEIAATEHTSPYYMGDVARVHAARFGE
ncbi:MAG: tetratricopeptide repeat protein [Planctomycetota bacterium]